MTHEAEKQANAFVSDLERSANARREAALANLAQERECAIADIEPMLCGEAKCKEDPCARFAELQAEQERPRRPTIDELRAERNPPKRVLVLPTEAKERNAYPMFDGLFGYFPNALAAIARLSFIANEQHNPGEPMHWAVGKSPDHANKIMKHMLDHGHMDTDGTRHSTKVGWRALALLEDELVAAGAPRGRNAY